MKQTSLKTNPQIPNCKTNLKGQLVNISGFAGHTFWSPKQPEMLCKWVTVARSSEPLFTKQVLGYHLPTPDLLYLRQCLSKTLWKYNKIKFTLAFSVLMMGRLWHVAVLLVASLMICSSWKFGCCFPLVPLHTYLILSHFAYCASQILCCVPVEGLWQSCVKQVSQPHFPSNICSLLVSVSRFGNSPNISKLFIINMYVINL